MKLDVWRITGWTLLVITLICVLGGIWLYPGIPVAVALLWTSLISFILFILLLCVLKDEPK